MIVVMTQREKIAMEALFRRTIPPHKRDGCQFVFRQARAGTSPAPSCAHAGCQRLWRVTPDHAMSGWHPG